MLTLMPMEHGQGMHLTVYNLPCIAWALMSAAEKASPTAQSHLQADSVHRLYSLQCMATRLLVDSPAAASCLSLNLRSSACVYAKYASVAMHQS